MTDSTNPLDRIVANATELYTLPAVAMKVLELTDNPQVDVRALKQCIENDPALTTKILRVVNSSLFGLTREVSDLNQALALLGIKPLKLLVLGFSLPEGLFEGLAAEVLGHYWRHTLTKAVAARRIAETLWNEPGDEAFIAGLLQDLGILLLIQELGQPYVKCLERTRRQGNSLPVLETESLGFDHTMLTSRLLDSWGLPDSLVKAVCWQAARQALSSSVPPVGQLPQIVRLAELVARLLADGRPETLSELLAASGQSHEISDAQLEEMLNDLEEKVEQLADVLSLRLPEGHDYKDILSQAHSQLADVATEAAGDLIRQQFNEPAADPEEEEDEDVLDEFHALSQAIASVSRRDRDPGSLSPSAQPSSISHTANARRQRPEPSQAASKTRCPAAGRIQTSSAQVCASPAAKPAVAEADPGMLGQLASAVVSCRRSHCALSLLLLELDDTDDLMMIYGLVGLEKLRQLLESECRHLEHDGAICLPQGDYGCAVILPDCDRQPAVRLGSRLIEQLRSLTSGLSGSGRPAVSVSAGLATVSLPPKNFLPEDLFKGAARCLYGSHASGGGVVKSIEIY